METTSTSKTDRISRKSPGQVAHGGMETTSNTKQSETAPATGPLNETPRGAQRSAPPLEGGSALEATGAVASPRLWSRAERWDVGPRSATSTTTQVEPSRRQPTQEDRKWSVAAVVRVDDRGRVPLADVAMQWEPGTEASIRPAGCDMLVLRHESEPSAGWQLAGHVDGRRRLVLPPGVRHLVGIPAGARAVLLVADGGREICLIAVRATSAIFTAIVEAELAR